MAESKDYAPIEFGGPAIYRIVVQGHLGNDWSGRLAGMDIAATSGEGKNPVTTLQGKIRDQAELNGVLETLYSLHLSILKVETIGADD